MNNFCIGVFTGWMTWDASTKGDDMSDLDRRDF